MLDALARDPNVDATTFRVAYLIATRINLDTGWAYPSRKSITEEAGCSAATVKRAVRRLVEGGWLVRRKVGKGAQASEYEIDWGRWTASDDEAKAKPGSWRISDLPAGADLTDIPFLLPDEPVIGGVTHDPREGSPMTPGGVTHDPREGSPMTPQHHKEHHKEHHNTTALFRDDVSGLEIRPRHRGRFEADGLASTEVACER